ncbi:MAG: hypothetical protein ACYDAN_04410, partial [Candidatus Limnocylindrales bacterium]
ELAANGATIPIVALDGAGIPPAANTAGRSATIVGIVRRPYPTASDRRYSVLPRRASDVTLGAIVAATPGSSAGSSGGTGAGSGVADPGASGMPAAGGAPTVDLRELAARIGQRIHVGGIVTEAAPDGFRLDDGTATARIVLEGDAADLAAVVAPGDALDASGVVEDRGGLAVVVRDPADVMLVGDLGDEPEASGAAAALAAVIDSMTPTLTVTARRATLTEAGAVAAIVVVLAVIAAGAAFGARRLRDRRRLSDRLRSRLAALASAAATPMSPRAGVPGAAPAGPMGVTDA